MRETKRLILKDYDEKYIEKAHQNFFSSLETSKYVLWRPTKSAIDVKNKIEYWLNEVKIDIFWIIHIKETDEPIGFISASKMSNNVFGDIGIVIGENFVKKGYGSEVLKELIEYIKSLGGKEIHYSHFKENKASERLAIRLGFKYYKKDKRIRTYDKKEFEELFYILKI